MDKIKLQLIKNFIRKPKKLLNVIMSLGKKNKQPLVVDLEPTTRCNLNCIMCKVPIWKKKHPDLTFDEFKDIIDQLPNILVLKLQGMGEPLLNKNFSRMIEYANSKHIITKTTSNATILNDELSKEIIDSGLKEISFSLDGATKSTFESIRRGANFEKVINNIKRFIELRSGKFPIVKIWTVLREENKNEIKDIIKLSKKLEVDGIILQTKLSSFGEGDIFKTIKIKPIKGIGIFYGDIYTPKNYCKQPWLNTYITVDKYITPCCARPNPDNFNFGNLKDNKFKDIWNNDKYKVLRKRMKCGNIPKLCEECYRK